jgi:hypothetical protein
MAVALDSSTPDAVYGASNPAQVTCTPPAGALLIALTLADGGNTFTLSDSSGLTWTQLDYSEDASASSWWAYTDQGGTSTVSSQRHGSYEANALQVLVFIGAVSQPGAHAMSTPGTASYTATADGSLGVALCAADIDPPAPAAISGCEWISRNTSRLSGYGGGGFMRRSSDDGVSGQQVSLGCTNDHYNTLAIEVTPAAQTSTPATAAGPATRLAASVAAGAVAAGAVLAGPAVHARAQAPAGTVAAGTGIPATVTGPPTSLTGSAPAGSLSAPATLYGAPATATVTAPPGALTGPAVLNGVAVRLTASAPAGGVVAGQTVPRVDVSLTVGSPELRRPTTVGPPETRWSVGPPETRWSVGPPETDRGA